MRRSRRFPAHALLGALLPAFRPALLPALSRRAAALAVALGMCLQAGSPAFVSACQRNMMARPHACVMCDAGGAKAPTPACHARGSARPAPERRGLMPCCFLSADAGGALAALPPVTLRAPQATASVPALAVVLPAGASTGPAADRFEFPPGAPAPPGGALTDLRHTILRL
jgi:hypothetical protein